MNPLSSDRAWALFYRDGLPTEKVAALLGCSVEDIEGLKRPLDRVFDVAADLLTKKQAAIDDLNVELENCGKTMLNLAKALDDATGRKKAEREATKQTNLLRVKLGRNQNYWQSVKLGLREAIWWAPTTLILPLRMPLQTATTGVFVLVVHLLTWVVLRPGFLFAGLSGFLLPPPAKQL